MTKPPRIRRWISGVHYLWAALILLLAVFLYYLGYTSASLAFLKDAGSAVGGGAIAALLFNWLTQQSADLSIAAIIRDALTQVVTPIRESAVRDALSDYKWYVRIENPSATDLAQDYFVQLIKISYLWPELPKRIKIVAATSNVGGALAPWANDPEKGIAWKIETPGSKLDIRDRSVFDVGALRVNSRDLRVGPGRIVKVNGGEAREHIAICPSDLVGTTCRFEVEIRARMFVVHAGRLFTSSQFYRPVANGEFLYMIAEDIRVIDLEPILGEMTAHLPAPLQISSDRIWALSRSIRVAHVVFDSLMARGSAIRFEWNR